MKKIFIASFQIGSFYHSNIVLADNIEAAEKEYSKYAWYSIKEGSEADLKEAEKKGKPVITIGTAEPEAVQTEEAADNDEIMTNFYGEEARITEKDGVINVTITDGLNGDIIASRDYTGKSFDDICEKYYHCGFRY